MLSYNNVVMMYLTSFLYDSSILLLNKDRKT